jgi:hypothetical protein
MNEIQISNPWRYGKTFVPFCVILHAKEQTPLCLLEAGPKIEK